MGKDYYEILGVSREATKEEIASAFRKQAAKFHPDRHPGDKAAEESFKRVAEAYQVLSDPKAREIFDRGGEERVRQDTAYRGFGTTEEILSHFAELFGNGGGRYRVWTGGFDGGRRIPDFVVEEETAAEPEAAEYSARVDVFTALLGGTIEFKLPAGRVEMRIPAGTQPGQKFRLKGQGPVDPWGRRADALVRVDVTIPRALSSEQRRLIAQARAPLAGPAAAD
jgi:DnaJ-class molecular chaperone